MIWLMISGCGISWGAYTVGKIHFQTLISTPTAVVVTTKVPVPMYLVTKTPQLLVTHKTTGKKKKSKWLNYFNTLFLLYLFVLTKVIFPLLIRYFYDIN